MPSRPKSLLSRLTIRNQLMLLTILFLGGFAHFSYLAYDTLLTLKVNGPYYDRVIQSKDLIADVLPPPEFIIEAHLLVLQMVDEEDSEQLTSLLRSLNRLENDYVKRHQFWVENLAESPLKEILVVQSYEPARQFFGTMHREFIPLVLSGDHAKAEALAKGVLRQHYQAHRASIDQVVEMTQDRIEADEQEAKQVIAARTKLISIIGLVLAIIVCWTSEMLGRRITSRLDETVRVLDAVAAGDLNQQFESVGNDEIDHMGLALNKAIAASRENLDSARAAEQTIRVLNSDLEARVTRRTEELEKAKAEADRANHAKSTFLATMSHELRTPLNGILGMNELLLGTPLNDKQREFVNASRTSGKVLLQLINDVLDLSKIEAGKLELDLQESPIETLIYDVVEALHHSARQKGLKLHAHVDPNVCVTARCDGLRLRQMLVNLIGNSIKFTASGSVNVRAERITGDDSAARFRFSVSDTGIGIPEDRRERLFSPFTQADSSTTRQFGGTGLGLSIVKQLVELMHGTIGIESSVGHGSTFWFELPLEVTPSTIESVRASAAFADARILVVNLVEQDNSQLFDCLRAWGCLPEYALNHSEAVQAVTRAFAEQAPFSLVLVECSPGSSARFELIDAMSHRFHLPVIAFGSTLDDREGQLIQQLGARHWLPEPVRPSALFNVLASTLSPISGDAAPKPRAVPSEPTKLCGHVLVAEDNRINQMYVQELLTHIGCTCDVAATGDEVLVAVQRRSYDIVLMDCHMPEMDGFTAAREIRRLESEHTLSGRLRIVALTANALKGDRERCLDAGMDDYLSKPVEAAPLREALSKNLAANAAPVATPIEPPDPIDLAALVDRCLGNVRFAQSLLEEFDSTSLERLDELAAHATQANLTTIAEMAHAFKGAAGIIGAGTLRQLSSQVEASAHAEDVIGTLELVSQLRSEFLACRRFVNRLRDENKLTATLASAQSSAT